MLEAAHHPCLEKKRACNLTARERQTLQELFELNPAIGYAMSSRRSWANLLR